MKDRDRAQQTYASHIASRASRVFCLGSLVRFFLFRRRIANCSTRYFLIAASFALAGCVTNSSPQPDVYAEQTGSIPAEATSMQLQAGEKIRVTVYGETSLSGDYPIDANGFVSLPLVGAIRADGLSASELENRLSEKFRSQYLRSPKVTVIVVEYLPIYIIGEVQRPGVYPYNSRLNILRAIAVAGGTTYRASNSTVEIQHSGDTTINRYPAGTPVPVLPGDLIRVPQRYFFD